MGTRLATRLAERKGALNLVLAVLIVIVALYMLYRTATELGWLCERPAIARELAALCPGRSGWGKPVVFRAARLSRDS